ncbi:hypothetical protein Ccrd_008955 [Cynara cardunculus var. scolymus]|uniref:ABI family n=1 Tax=Cynara cardunculus var. scolymus TaxID=59895 RepID=A0A103XEA5_CYNCS|nr:hypothetical protein Ccrd_008955 [Cynara cardunculus var. scolymus]
MEVEQSNQAMAFHGASMEQSIGFVKALQELKHLRPQLYSAAEYCEKSYLHNYAVRALVNAVDHLGTVAYKFTDLLDQQALEISTTGLHVTCLHQIQTAAKQSHFQSRPRQYTSGTPAANTLCWHLASETKSTLKGNSRPMSVDDPKTSGRAPVSFNASNGDNGMRTKSAEAHLQLRNMGPASSAAIRTLGISRQDSAEGPKPMMPFRSFDNPKHEITHVPLRSKSVLSAFFVKQKTPKLRTSAVS